MHSKNSFFLYAIIALFTLTTITGCKKKQERTLKSLQEDFIEPPQMTLTKSDTDQVKSLVNYYLETLKAGKVDQAVSMLYYLKKDSITKLPPELAKKEHLTLSMFKGLQSKIDYIIFSKETDSEVKYTVKLFDKKPNDKAPNEISFIIKPVRREGKWYLTLADTATQTQESEVEKLN